MRVQIVHEQQLFYRHLNKRSVKSSIKSECLIIQNTQCYFHITLYIVPPLTISVKIASVSRSGRHVRWKP